METLTRAELLEQIIFMKRHMNRADVEQIIDRLFSLITNRLASGEIVRLSGFGNFNLIDKDERPGRNPKTGESIPVSSRRVTAFKAGAKLRAIVSSFSKRVGTAAKRDNRKARRVEAMEREEELETV